VCAVGRRILVIRDAAQAKPNDILIVILFFVTTRTPAANISFLLHLHLLLPLKQYYNMLKHSKDS